MNTFMKIKMEASGYPVGCTTPPDKAAFIESVRVHDGIYLSYDDIVYNAERRTVPKRCLNNICGKCTKPRQVHERVCDRTSQVL